MTRAEGQLDKLRIDALADPESADGTLRARYRLRAGASELPLDTLVGARVRLTFDGAIHCVHCGRSTRKSFNQGYCFPCFSQLAQCDACVMAPEKCHYDQGTCREPEWGEQHCMQPHVVYLANTTGVKVGITRATQVPTRWLDQGAVAAIPFARTATRQQAGFVEDLLRAELADRTQWQRLLKGDPEPVDLSALRAQLIESFAAGLDALRARFGLQSVVVAEDVADFRVGYPVSVWPTKVRSLNPEQTPAIEGDLLGIKGQYLILDCGVINIRKFSGWRARFEAL